MRTFVALPVETDLGRRFCERAREHLQAGGADVKWVAPEHYHVTLRFLGETRDDELDGVIAAVQEAAAQVPPFEARLTELGAFPSVRRPQTLWLGVEDPTGRLAALERALTAALDRLGRPADGKAFHPHITLGRVRRNAGGLGALIQRMRDGAPRYQGAHDGFGAERLILFQSDLTQTGPIYTPLWEEPLGG